MGDEYEQWAAKPPHKSYQLSFEGDASGYLSGLCATVTMQLYASSHADAMRMFNDALAKAGMVNLSDYHVCRRD
jgi:hypothetical protein